MCGRGRHGRGWERWPAIQRGRSPLGISSHITGETASAEDWVFYIGSWIVMGLGCTVGQDLVQRSLASRNEKIAVSSAVMSGFFYAAIGLVPITIGFAARTVLANHGVTEAMMGGDVGLENQVLRACDHRSGQPQSDCADGVSRRVDLRDHEFGGQLAAGRIIIVVQQRHRFDLDADE